VRKLLFARRGLGWWLTARDLAVREVVLRDREVIGAGWPLGEYAYLVDEVWDELAPPHLEYLDGLSRGLQGGALPYLVARRTVAIDQDPSPLLRANV
jgi:hypothetical protein